MKYIVFLFCLFAWAGSFAAHVEPITVCSLFTDYEAGLKHCTKAIKKGEEKCKEEIGFLVPIPPLVSQAVSDTIMAIYKDIHNVCVAEGADADIVQCILERVTSAKAEHCAD